MKFEHLRQMAQIEREAFEMPWTEAMFIPEVQSENAVYLVGVRGDEVVCYGGYHKVLDEAHITNIAVKSTERGKGIGKLLMSMLIAKAKESGVKTMSLEVRENNEAAIKMYLSFGFKIDGVRKRYYDYKFDAYNMSADIGGY